MARKKLEGRRLAFDASAAKMNKARRDDFRIEEEVRMNRAKFEESEEDVLRRMQDIREAEVDTITSLTGFLDAELEYHERAAEELRRTKDQWAGVSAGASSPTARPRQRSRSNTARSWQGPRQAAVHEEDEPAEPEQVPRLPVRPSHNRSAPPLQPARPSANRATTFDGRLAPTALSYAPPMPHNPLSRIQTDRGTYGTRGGDDIFNDDRSSNSGTGSPEHTERSASPATSYGSLSRSASAVALKKAPPPPPPASRSKRPPPPPPARKCSLGY